MFLPSISADILSLAVPSAVTDENLRIPLSTIRRRGLYLSVIISDVLSILSISLFVSTIIFVSLLIGIADL